MNTTQSMDLSPPTLGWLDLGMFVSMLGCSAIIGSYFGCCSGRQDSAKEYLIGGKTMGIFPTSLSLVASFISGITMLGLPTEIYRFGTQYWVVIITVQLVALTIATVHVPLYTKLQLTSCYQYLELRFDKKVRKMASILFVVSQVFYIPIVIYVPALAFSQVTGINVHMITPVTCLVCIFYTTVGGLRGVVWTDALQTIIMFGAMFTVLGIGSNQVGGWGEVWSRSESGHRFNFFNMNPDPLQRQSFWSVLVGIYFQFLAECGVGQGFVQRYLSVPDLRTAKITLLWFSIGLVMVSVLCFATGLLIFATYHLCDPLSSGRIQQPDQLLPLLVLDVAGHIPGLSGLFVAGVFSAALSSMSTGLNAMSGVLVEDLLAGVLSKRLSTATWLRTCAALSGAVCVALVLVVERLGGVMQAASSLSGITSGTMLGLFTLGMFFPRANSKGALVGSVVSLILVSCVVGGAQSAIASGALVHQTLPVSVEECGSNVTMAVIASSQSNETQVWWIFRISFMYYSLLGAAIVLLVGLPASYWLSDEDNLGMNPDLFSPLVKRFLQPAPREGKPLVDINNEIQVLNGTKD